MTSKESKGKFLIKLLKKFKCLKDNNYHESRYCVMVIISIFPLYRLDASCCDRICEEFIQFLQEWSIEDATYGEIESYTVKLIKKDMLKSEKSLQNRTQYFIVNNSMSIDKEREWIDIILPNKDNDAIGVHCNQINDFFDGTQFAYFDDICLFYKLMTGQDPPTPPLFCFDTGFIILKIIAKYCTQNYWIDVSLAVCEKFRIENGINRENLNISKNWLTCVLYATIIVRCNMMIHERDRKLHVDTEELENTKSKCFDYFLNNLEEIGKFTYFIKNLSFRLEENNDNESTIETINVIKIILKKIVDVITVTSYERWTKKKEFSEDRRKSFFQSLRTILMNIFKEDELIEVGRNILEKMKKRSIAHSFYECSNNFHFKLLAQIYKAYFAEEINGDPMKYFRLVKEFLPGFCSCVTPREIYSIMGIEYLYYCSVKRDDLLCALDCIKKHLKNIVIYNSMNVSYKLLNDRLIEDNEEGLFKIYKILLKILCFDDSKDFIITIITTLTNGLSMYKETINDENLNREAIRIINSSLDCLSISKKKESTQCIYNKLIIKNPGMLNEILEINKIFKSNSLSDFLKELVLYEGDISITLHTSSNDNQKSNIINNKPIINILLIKLTELIDNLSIENIKESLLRINYYFNIFFEADLFIKMCTHNQSIHKYLIDITTNTLFQLVNDIYNEFLASDFVSGTLSYHISRTLSYCIIIFLSKNNFENQPITFFEDIEGSINQKIKYQIVDSLIYSIFYDVDDHYSKATNYSSLMSVDGNISDIDESTTTDEEGKKDFIRDKSLNRISKCFLNQLTYDIFKFLIFFVSRNLEDSFKENVTEVMLKISKISTRISYDLSTTFQVNPIDNVKIRKLNFTSTFFIPRIEGILLHIKNLNRKEDSKSLTDILLSFMNLLSHQPQFFQFLLLNFFEAKMWHKCFLKAFQKYTLKPCLQSSANPNYSLQFPSYTSDLSGINKEAFTISMDSKFNINLETGLSLTFKMKINNWEENRKYKSNKVHISSFSIMNDSDEELSFKLSVNSSTGSFYISLYWKNQKVEENKVALKRWDEDEWKSVSLQIIYLKNTNNETSGGQFLCKFSENCNIYTLTYKNEDEKINIEEFLTKPLSIHFGFMEFLEKTSLQYQLSNIFSFKGILQFENLFILHSLSPNVKNFMRTESNIPYPFYNFYPILNGKFLRGKKRYIKSILKIIESPEPSLRLLQKKTVFIIDAEEPKIYYVSKLNPTALKLTNIHYNNSNSSSYGFNFQSNKSNDGVCFSTTLSYILSLIELVDFNINWNGQPRIVKNFSFINDLSSLCPTKTLIYLYARTVELNFDEYQDTDKNVIKEFSQSIALKMLINSVKNNVISLSEFDIAGGVFIPLRVFTSKSCKVTKKDIYNVLSLAISDLVYVKSKDTESGEIIISSTLYSIVRDGQMLLYIFHSLHLWNLHGFNKLEALILLVKMLTDCITEKKCIFAKNNKEEIVRNNLIRTILNAYSSVSNENIPENKEVTLKESSINNFIDNSIYLFKELCTLEENFSALFSLWRFLFMTHPATNFCFYNKDVGHPSNSMANFNGSIDHILKNGGNNWIDFTDFNERVNLEFPLDETIMSRVLSEFILKYKNEINNGNITCNTFNNISNARKLFLGVNEDDYIKTSSPKCFREFRDILHRIANIKIKDEENGNTEKESDWMVKLRALIIDFLSSSFVICSDNVMIQIYDAIHWYSILVLNSRQRDENIQTNIFKLLSKFISRLPEEMKMDFIKQGGFYIIGNQINNLTVINMTIINSLFSLMCLETVDITQGLDENHIKNIPPNNMTFASFTALFSLLEKCSEIGSEIDLIKLLGTFTKIFISNSMLRQVMMECGLMECTFNVMRNILKRKDFYRDDKNDRSSPNVVLMETFVNFLRYIAINSIPYDNTIFYEKCKGFAWNCLLLEYTFQGYISSEVNNKRNSEKEREENVSLILNASRKLRELYTLFIRWWLESIREVFGDSYIDTSASGRNSPEDFETIENEKNSSYDDFNVGDTSKYFTFIAFKHNIENGKNEKCIYKWKSQTTPECMKVLAERLLFALEHLTKYYLFHGNNGEQGNRDYFIAAEELDSFILNFQFMYYIWIVGNEYEMHGGIEKKGGKGGILEWHQLLVLCKPKIGILILRILACTLCSIDNKLSQCKGDGKFNTTNNFERRPPLMAKQIRLIQIIAKELPDKNNYLKKLFDIDLDLQYCLNIGIHEIILSRIPLSKEATEHVELDRNLMEIIEFLKSINIKGLFIDLSIDAPENIVNEEVYCYKCYIGLKKKYISELRSKATLYYDILQVQVSQTTDFAFSVTRLVNEYHHDIRKLFGKFLETILKNLYEAEQNLLEISSCLTHPEGPLKKIECWPKGWALERTENGIRERKRLCPFDYNYSEKYVMNGNRQNMIKAKTKPLYNLLLNDRVCKEDSRKNGILQSFNQVALSMDYVKNIDDVRQSVTVTVVMPNLECYGELILALNCIYFFGENAKTSQKGLECDPFSLYFECSKIKEIYKRQYLLKDTALELFFTDGETLLLSFVSKKEREHALEQFLSLELPNLIVNLEGQLKNISQSWRQGIITTFEYLMLLNKLAGRSYNDLMQYPVFPFVLSDYTSETLNLNNPNSYRVLQKPIAIQDKTKEKYYVSYYNDLDNEYRRFKATMNSDSMNFSGMPVKFGPYHYGSHYSNSGIITHFLVRLSPFTSVALEYQDNHFDIADRLFNSLETTWNLASSRSTTDFKELTPEFFYFPEFLLNKNNLDLGVRQDGVRVDDIKLPPWVPNNNARIFTLIHRQALESAYVSSNLHNWIDLIFGFKQSGEAAVKAVNVFHPLTYRFGTNTSKAVANLNASTLENDADKVDDEILKVALKTMIKTYGQMPAQLFSTSHLPRLSKIVNQNQVPVPSPLSTISGLKWGDYVGSPNFFISEESPYVVKGKNDNSNQNSKDDNKKIILYESPSTFVSPVIGVPDGIILLRQQNDIKKKPYYTNESDYDVFAAVNWKNKANVLRIRFLVSCGFSSTGINILKSYNNEEGSPWQNFWHMGYEKASCVIYSTCNSRLFVGFQSGVIKILQLNFIDKRCYVSCKYRQLLGHYSPITSLSISDNFSIVVSTCRNGKIIIWDSNKNTFVRNIELPNIFNNDKKRDHVISLTSISQTSGDIAIIVNGKSNKFNTKNEMSLSKIFLYTINGDLIGNIDSQYLITSIAMTNLSEGISVNSLILGLENGIVQMIEMWTLSLIREFKYSDHPYHQLNIEYTSERDRSDSFYKKIVKKNNSIENIPSIVETEVVGIICTNSGKRLFVAYNDGTVLCWQAGGNSFKYPSIEYLDLKYENNYTDNNYMDSL